MSCPRSVLSVLFFTPFQTLERSHFLAIRSVRSFRSLPQWEGSFPFWGPPGSRSSGGSVSWVLGCPLSLRGFSGTLSSVTSPRRGVQEVRSLVLVSLRTSTLTLGSSRGSLRQIPDGKCFPSGVWTRGCVFSAATLLGSQMRSQSLTLCVGRFLWKLLRSFHPQCSELGVRFYSIGLGVIKCVLLILKSKSLILKILLNCFEVPSILSCWVALSWILRLLGGTPASRTSPALPNLWSPFRFRSRLLHWTL